MNLPPEILLPRGGEDEVHNLDLRFFNTAKVLMREPDGDQLTFDWSYPRAAEVELIETPVSERDWSSELKVLNLDPSLHGQQVTCTILDDAVPANVRQVKWIIKLQEDM